MRKKRYFDDNLVTISVTLYKSELERIDEAIEYSTMRGRSSFMTSASLVMAKKVIHAKKDIVE